MPKRSKRATRNKNPAYSGPNAGGKVDRQLRKQVRSTATSSDGDDDDQGKIVLVEGTEPGSKVRTYPGFKDVMSEALATFKLIDKNRRTKKTLGRAEMNYFPCTCVAKYVKGRNVACSGEDCINGQCRIECVGRKTRCGSNCQNRHFTGSGKKVKLDVIRLQYKGYGIRAREDIAKGQFVLEYMGDIITFAEMAERTRKYENAGNKHFYFMEVKAGEYIDATQHGSLGRFVNHSCKPNCEIQKWDVGGEVRMGLFALRDILKDEEVAFDYRAVTSGSEAQPCHCGEEGCTEVLGRQKKRITVTAQKSEESHSGIVLTPDARTKISSESSAAASVVTQPHLVMSNWFGHAFPAPETWSPEGTRDAASPVDDVQDVLTASPARDQVSQEPVPEPESEPEPNGDHALESPNSYNDNAQDLEPPSSPLRSPDPEKKSASQLAVAEDGQVDPQVYESTGYDSMDLSDGSDLEIVDIQTVENRFEKTSQGSAPDPSFEMEIDSVELSPTFVQALDLSSDQVQTLVDELMYLKVSEGIQDDEELLTLYSDRIPINELSVSSVGKVMRTLLHSPHVVLAKLILSRIHGTDQADINYHVMRLHGYQIFERILCEAEKFGDETVLMMFEIMERWPRMSKNKISASNIESVTTHIRDTTKSTQVRSHATLLCEEWGKLQNKYRIPKKKSTSATLGNSASEDEGEDIGESSVIVEQVLYDDDSDDEDEGGDDDSEQDEEDHSDSQPRGISVGISGHRSVTHSPEQYEISSDLSGDEWDWRKQRPLTHTISSDSDSSDHNMARLPKGWKSNTAKGGHVYYYNDELNIRQWHRPDSNANAEQGNNTNNSTTQGSQSVANGSNGDNRGEKRDRGGDEQKRQNGANKRRRADRSSSTGSGNNNNRSKTKNNNRRQNGKDSSRGRDGQTQGATSANESNDDKSAEIQRIISNASKEKLTPAEASESNKSEEPGKSEDLKSLLTKSFARYVPNVVSRYEKELGRDNCKRFSKEIVKVLVEKELRPDHHVRHPEHLSDEKKEKVKDFVKSYMKKAVEKYRQKRRERHGSAEVQSNEHSRDQEDAQDVRSSSVEAVTRAVTEDVAAEISSAMLNDKNEEQSKSWNDGTAEIDLEDDD